MKPLFFAAAATTLLLGLAGAGATTPATTPAATATASDNAPLSLEQLFRAQPYRGEPARELRYSRSGRYLAYLWNPHGEPGSDLYVHDQRSGKTWRLSSPERMAAFDAPEALQRFERKRRQRDAEWAERQAREEAQAAYLRGAAVDLYQWENAALERVKALVAQREAREEARKAEARAEAEAEKQAAAALAARRAGQPEPAASAAAAAPKGADKAADKKPRELWEWRDELKQQQARDKLKPADLYPGVSQMVWAERADELILQYRGSLLRWQAAAPERLQPLVSGQRPLRIVAYTPDDRGFVYMDETRLLRSRFDAAGVQLLNRELIHDEGLDEPARRYRIESSSLSEDGRYIALLARAPLVSASGSGPAPKPGRQVEIMSYEQRFATAKKVDREVSDDKRMLQPLALYVRAVPGLDSAPAPQGEPVFSHPGGDAWFEISPVVWARDGSHYAFVTWERERELLRVYLGRPGEPRPERVLERRGDVHHELVNVMTPQFTPDGRRLVLMLAENDFRQPWAWDIAARRLDPLLPEGLAARYEAHPVLGFSPDGRQMLLRANRDDAAAMNLYRVDLLQRRMQALGAASDYHRNPAVSWDGSQVAAVAGHWGERPELKLLDGLAAPRQLTRSHDPAWAQVDRLRPQRFSYRNRHGDEIAAYVFKPAGWQPSDRRPAVVYTYGGPLNDRHSVEVDSFQPTGYLFAMYMAVRHGYVMVTVDPRGHSNYGRRFAGANWEQPGVAQTEDLVDLAAHMQRELGVDPQRIGLNGWSFGGFQTQHTLYTQPDAFAAGIAGAGPTEWENYNSWYSGRTIGKVDRTKPVLRRYSLIPLARQLKKPLLLVHGMQDPNVLYQDTVNVYRALLESGKEALVDLFLDPDGDHGMGGAVKTLGWHRKYEAFWLRHLGRVTAQ